MIQQTHTVLPKVSWQTQLAQAIKEPEVLLSRLGIQQQLPPLDPTLLAQFPLKVTHSYLSKMQYGNPDDPLLRQVFPLIDESYAVSGFTFDPVGDKQAIRQAGLLQKYQGRALLLLTGACAIHCRYCFRRHFSYADSNPIAQQWSATIAALQQDSSINEVIFSGGDPLILSDDKLGQLINDLAQIPHLKRLRIHSRLPIVLPDRITTTLCRLLHESRLDIIMVVHANHAQELATDVANAMARLRPGCLLLNQSVLLKGINDNVETLATLSERLSHLGVTPYYLHLLDPVAGASHFDVSTSRGIALIQQLRSELSGYLVPRLVKELAGHDSKTLIA